MNKSRGVSLLGVLLALIVIGGLVFLGFTYKRWEGQAPTIALDREFKALGKSPALGLAVDDSGTGLKQVTIRLKQKDQDLVLADDTFSNGEKAKKYDLGQLMAGKVQEGPATLVVSASDKALRGFGRGNRAEITKDFQVDTKPPRVEVLSSQHYINQGGSERS